MGKTTTLQDIYDSLDSLKVREKEIKKRFMVNGKTREKVISDLNEKIQNLNNYIEKANKRIEVYDGLKKALLEKKKISHLNDAEIDLLAEYEKKIKDAERSIKSFNTQITNTQKKLTDYNQERQTDEKTLQELSSQRDDIIAQLIMHPKIREYMQVEINDEYNEIVSLLGYQKNDEVMKYEKVEKALTEDDTTKDIVTRLKEAYKNLNVAMSEFQAGSGSRNNYREADNKYNDISKELTERLKSLGVIDDVVDFKNEDDSRFVITMDDIDKIAGKEDEDYSECLSGKVSTINEYSKRINGLTSAKNLFLGKIENVKKTQNQGQTKVQDIDKELASILAFLEGENGSKSGYTTEKEKIESEYQDACDNLEGKNGKQKIDELIDAKQREIDEKKKVANPEKAAKKATLDKKTTARKNAENSFETFKTEKENKKAALKLSECMNLIICNNPKVKKAYEDYRRANIKFRQLMLEYIEKPFNEKFDLSYSIIKKAIDEVESKANELSKLTDISEKDWNMYVIDEAVKGKNTEELEDYYFDNSAKIKTQFAIDESGIKKGNVISESVDKLMELQNNVLSGNSYNFGEAEIGLFDDYYGALYGLGTSKLNRFFSKVAMNTKEMFRKLGNWFSKREETSQAGKRKLVEGYITWKSNGIDSSTKQVFDNFYESFLADTDKAKYLDAKEALEKARNEEKIAQKEYNDTEEFIGEDTSELEAQLQALMDKKGEYEEKRNNKDKKISELDTKKAEQEKRKQELLSQKQELSPHRNNEIRDGVLFGHQSRGEETTYITEEVMEWLNPEYKKQKEQEELEIGG